MEKGSASENADPFVLSRELFSAGYDDLLTSGHDIRRDTKGRDREYEDQACIKYIILLDPHCRR